MYRGPLLGTGLVWVASWLGSAALAVEASGDWPQWRGPQRDGTVAEGPWPASLDEAHLKQEWRIELGPSYSGPIVAGDHVYTTETRDKKIELVSAVQRSTGEVVWQVQWEGALSVPFFAKSNGDWIRSTPAYDEGRLYVAGMRDVLVCLDAATGQQLWRRDFVAELNAKVPDFGFVCSPLVVGDHVYVQAGGSFLKLDKRTGELVWRTLEDGGGMFGSAFSSPCFTMLGDTPQLIVQTRQKLAGVDPASGAVLWSQDVPAFRGMNILTPTVHDSAIFTSSYGGKSTLYRVSRTADEGWSVAEAWTNKTQGYMSSPVVIDGHAYLHLRNQRFTCIDLATGEEKWISPTFGKYWSLVSRGDKILALDERGELLLIQANPAEFQLLAQRKISDQETWAHLAVSGSELFVRELNGLAKFQWKP